MEETKKDTLRRVGVLWFASFMVMTVTADCSGLFWLSFLLFAYASIVVAHNRDIIEN